MLVTARSRDEGVATTASQPLEWGAVYRAHAVRVGRWAARLGGPMLDAEDIVQEVFLTVQRLLPGFRGDAEITTWLYRITANVVRHRRRKDRIRRWLGGDAGDVAGHIASARGGPVEDVERLDDQRLVYRVLDALPEKYRTVLILFEIEGLPGEEVARLLDARTETVWVWLHRARAKFLDELTKIEKREATAQAAPRGRKTP